MFRINYILKKPNTIVPWGETEKHLHWYGLTDGLLWINAGDSVIYEYAEPHADSLGIQIKYNDYQLSRFIEDILELSSVISEPIPELLYNVTEDLDEDLESWKANYIDKSDDEFDKFYDELFIPMSEWFYDRFLSSSHLVCGPSIGFFRCGEKLKIIWDSNRLEDGSEMWKYPRGYYEADYQNFVSEISRFLNSFMLDMDAQVSDVVSNGISGVYVDADGLIRENEQRKETFEQQMRKMSSDGKQETDWDRILDLHNMMQVELGKN